MGRITFFLIAFVLAAFSAFYAGEAFAANLRPSIGTITPSSGTSPHGIAVNFTATYSDPDGWQNMREVRLLINASVNGADCFYAYYDVATNKLYLKNNANTAWLGGYDPQSSNTIENSYAKLNCASTTVSGSGNALTVNWSVTFKPAFKGVKNSYLYVKDIAGAYNGWVKKGTWTIANKAPSVGAVTPSSGTSYSDQAINFTATYSDPDGWQNIQLVRFLINTSTSGTRCLYVYYDLASNKLYIRNDGNTAWLGGYAPQSSNIIESSYVKLNCASTTVSGSDNILTINWSVTFKPTFKGVKNVYLYVKDIAGAYNGWVKKGTTIIAALPLPRIATTGLGDAIAGEDYLASLNATDGTPPYAWSIESGNLPNGLSLSSAGTISGTPVQAASFNFVIKVTDLNQATDTQALSINVLPTFPLITDEELLDQTEAKAAMYFYNEILSNGFVKDTDYKDFSSIAATGFGLASLCVMAERYQTSPNWVITPEQARARVNQILDNCVRYQSYQALSGNGYGVAGFLYHFIKADGTRQGTCEVSTIDMALFLSGAIAAGEYFGGEVKTKADQIYNSMNWAYFLNTAKRQFSHGWFPDSGIMPATWDRPTDEAILVSLLAISANLNNSDMLMTMYSWPRAVGEYGGYSVVNSYFGSLFTYVFAHCFFDFEKLGTDNPSYAGSTNVPVNWWMNSVNAAYANRQFCIDNAINYDSYDENSWGITICEYPSGQYSDFLGAAPCESNSATPYHNGTIAPYGAISSMPLMRISPDETPDMNSAFKTLRYYYQTYYHHLWGEYGPKDSFNHNREFSNAYLGIDVGPEVLMIENYRSGLIWNNFMKNGKIQAATAKVFTGNLLDPTTMYVDASNLSDPEQDGSVIHPFNTIQKAIDNNNRGCVIEIAPGRYVEGVKIISKSNITLKGVIGDRDDQFNTTVNSVVEYESNHVIDIEGSINIAIDSLVIKPTHNSYDHTFGGGGVYNFDSDYTTIMNSIITGTRAESGYGISCYRSVKMLITNNLITNNSNNYGGGIYIYNDFTNNDINANERAAEITNNDIINNVAWGTGAGISVTGYEVSGYARTKILIRNNRVYNNSSDRYAGVYLKYSEGEVQNNTIVGNCADWLSGGGVSCLSSIILVSNNIIHRNTESLQGGAGIYIYGGAVTAANNVVTENNGIGIGCAGNFTAVLMYNNLYGNSNDYSGSVPGTGSISASSLFVASDTDGDPSNDDYHLQPGSPCINAGDPAIAYNDKDGTRNDMGVYGGPNSM
ncbi:MAG: glucoamylase family protein [Candidatus Omnitrophota bacterium]|nr:glucoamylase family protein [Candidatus Omnitrophota bacterium]